MSEGEAGVRGAEARERAALVTVKEALGPGDGGQPHRHYPFQDLRYGFESDYDAEGGRGVVGGFARLVKDDPVGGF